MPRRQAGNSGFQGPGAVSREAWGKLNAGDEPVHFLYYIQKHQVAGVKTTSKQTQAQIIYSYSIQVLSGLVQAFSNSGWQS